MIFMSLLLIVGCHSPKIEDNPSEKKKAISVAYKYTDAIFTSDYAKLRELSAVPYLTPKKVMLSQKHFDYWLKKETGHGDPDKINMKLPHYEILKGRFYTLEDIALIKPNLYKKLKEKNFNPEGMYFVQVAIELQGRPEISFLLVQKREGMWRVIGLMF